MVAPDKVNVLDYVSKEFMAMTSEEQKELDQRVDAAMEDAWLAMENAEIRRNDHYLKDSVVEEVGDASCE